MRVVLFTGKGGVGKTSVAAATAMRCASAGYRTVVMSTDPAHSLGDSFDIELGAEAVKVADNLWAHEVSSLHEMQRHWAKLHEYAVEVFSTQGLDEVLADEVANPPGMDEVASLMWIKHYAQRAEHDVLIVDCAPTGETLQLLTFPDVAKWWLDKIYPWSRRAMRVARPVLQPMMNMPLPSDEVYASLKDLLLDLDGMRKVLTDPEVTTVRIVLNLEKMVVKEAKRAYTYLSLFGYVTDAVVVNRLLPGELHDELFQKWQRIHHRYQLEVEQSFAGRSRRAVRDIEPSAHRQGRPGLRARVEGSVRREVGGRPEPPRRRAVRDRWQLPARDHPAPRSRETRYGRCLDRGRGAAGAVRAPPGAVEREAIVSGDRERVIELVNELASRVGHVLSDMIPPAAQVHLLNAQRELITALMLIYENRVAPTPAATRARRARTRRRTTTRDRKIPIE